MTYSQLKASTPTACTCSSCPMFRDYQDNGRGLCKVFDQVTYRHHSLTQDCLTSLPEIEDQVCLPEEDQDYCKYEPGVSVKLIDLEKDHSEWESFTVVGYKHNDNRYETIESCLTQPEWYVYIVSTTQPIPVPFWVAETEICLAEHSEFIATVEVF